MAGAFGTVFMPEMAITWFDGNGWSTPQMVASDSIPMHPGAHVLHYASTCFEGLKAFRHDDDSIHIFRMDKNIARFQHSSELLGLPAMQTETVTQMILDVVRKFASEVPEPPGSMYIRPTHIGTEPAIGKAAAPSSTSALYILLSPVGDYFSGSNSTLRLLLAENAMRCAPHNGMIKSGGNYASALQPILKARESHSADQVLFCPDGLVQETGAANFLLIENNELVTKPLDESFLHGVTRDSILMLAKDMGLTVSERELSIEELVERAQKSDAEAALSGTAAVLAPVGTLLHNDQSYTVGNGKAGKLTLALREKLNNIQWGKASDDKGWLVKV
jgi:branched-chain amino acid aminotransferase